MTRIDTYRLGVMKHRLDGAIGDEAARRAPDRFKLLRLKKLRLAIKDRLAGHFRRQSPA